MADVRKYYMFEFKSLKLSGIKGAQNIGTDKETKKRV